ncbi:uncharacterized protein Dwil_GK28040 [Drosophila willistoni]|uniref:Uncharacterized protein n=1 Tax=Drosophila willistoni TaxID=7260 RepID=A0A0Q9X002_DROWI|nr:uncharacterized protein Dwil_GK28040 [Drosophila willistoni]
MDDHHILNTILHKTLIHKHVKDTQEARSRFDTQIYTIHLMFYHADTSWCITLIHVENTQAKCVMLYRN